MNPFFIIRSGQKDNLFPLGFEKEYPYYNVEEDLERRYRNHQLRLAWRTKMTELRNLLVTSTHNLFNPTYAPKPVHAKVIASHKHGHR